jgi:hypothetical protein
MANDKSIPLGSELNAPYTPPHVRIAKQQRPRLFEAAGIIAVSRAALATKLEGLSDESIIDALAAAATLIEGVAAALAEDAT